jgi:hypothetical protein
MKLTFLKRDIPKRPAIVVAVALLAAASLVIGREKPALEVVQPSSAPTRNTAAAPEIDLDKLNRTVAADAPQNDPFAARNFAPAPRNVAPARRGQANAAAASAPKAAPPLPFTYAGWVSQDGKTEVYVQRGTELISLEAGQKIEPDYRVDSITDSSIRFTYLPMKTPQVLERAAPEEGRQVVERAKPEGGRQMLERDPGRPDPDPGRPDRDPGRPG